MLVLILKTQGTFYLFQPQVQLFYNILYFFSQLAPFAEATYTACLIRYLLKDAQKMMM